MFNRILFPWRVVFDFGGQFSLDAPGLINKCVTRLGEIDYYCGFCDTFLGLVCFHRKEHSMKHAVAAAAENRNRQGQRHPRESFYQVHSEGAQTSN